MNLDNSVEAIIHDANFCSSHQEDMDDEGLIIIPSVVMQPEIEQPPTPKVEVEAVEVIEQKSLPPSPEETYVDLNIQNDEVFDINLLII